MKFRVFYIIFRKRFWFCACCFFFIYMMVKLCTIVELQFQCIYDEKRVNIVANYSYLISKNHTTKLISNISCNKEAINVLILVTSNISNFDRRETIRRTWGKRLNQHRTNDFRTFFLISKSRDKEMMNVMQRESSRHGDLIISDFFEDFYALSYKVESGFEWAYKYCSYNFLLKADDDVHVNIGYLSRLLKDEKIPKNNLYLGFQHHQPRVFREGKYNVEKTEYSSNCYPDYCSGGAVVFSSDLVKNMIPYIQPDPLKIDDAYIGILARNAGVKPFHHDGFSFYAPSCDYNFANIAHHPVKTRLCMERVHYGMIAYNNESPFVRNNYIESLIVS